MEDKIGSPKMDDKKFQALNQKASFEKAKTKRIKDRRFQVVTAITLRSEQIHSLPHK